MNKKILVVETSADQYENSGRKTGIWLEEITSFYKIVRDNGYDVDFISPKGGAVAIDPASAMADAETESVAHEEYFEQYALKNTKKASDVDAKDYIAIYFGGGHGAMFDFPDDENLIHLAQDIYKNGGYITSICHGEAGLINLKDEGGRYLVEGKKINGFTDEEERMNGTADEVPFLGESKLRERGANFVKGNAYTEFAVEDQRFITGQNPMSSHKVGKMLVEALSR